MPLEYYSFCMFYIQYAFVMKLHSPFSIDLILLVLIQPDHLKTCGTGPEQLERSCSVQRSWECTGQICIPYPMRSRCSRALTSIDFYNWHKRQLSIMWNVLSHDKYYIDLITVKESNHENKDYVVKTRYMVAYHWLVMSI